MPRHSAAAFKDLLTWLVMDSGRALSLDSFVRTAGAFLTISALKDWTKTAEVKAHVKGLKVAHGLESQPATHGTRRMLNLILNTVIPRRASSLMIRARSKLFLVLEAVGGLRVGEAMGGGDHHGMLANNICLLKDSRDGSMSVEARLEHTKTKQVRWINMVGETRTSRINVAGILADYWKQCGMKTISRSEGAYVETRPDYWVVRVSLLGGTSLTRLERVLRTSKVKEVQLLASSSMSYATKRSALKHDAEEKAYVNVAGGARDSAGIQMVIKDLKAAGLGSVTRLVMGPLIRSTAGSNVTHMPLSVDSTYKLLGAAMDEAFVLANDSSLGPDPELDLNGALKPHWSHHSWRRFSDKVARETRNKTGASDMDIDLFYGWQEAMYRKLMQIHYAGRSDRVKRSRVTMLV